VFICASNPTALEVSEKAMRHSFPYLEQHYLLAEEELWPFCKNSLDLVVQNLSLHQNNDMGIAFSRILESLNPDGVLIGHCYGKYTLEELKSSMYMAEHERSGGFAQHTFNFEEIASIGNLVDRVGYRLTSFTEKEFIEEFESAFHLFDYLSMHGMSFSGNDSRDTVMKDLFLSCAAIYNLLYGRKYTPGTLEEASADKSLLEKLKDATVIPATFHVVQYMGWKHDLLKQQQPKERGSGGSLESFVDELVKDDPTLRNQIKFGFLGEDGTVKAEEEKIMQEKMKYGHGGPAGEGADKGKK